MPQPHKRRWRSQAPLRNAVLSTAALSLALLGASASYASSGGVGLGGGGGAVAGSKAKLVHGKAIPPRKAPSRVVKVIDAANRIRNKPYLWGGGHGSWQDSGYDCSGAVSYALHGGGLLSSPLDSSGLAHWGVRGKGRWISVYGAGSHAYMVVAGLRFDTAMTAGDGPSWSKSLRSTPESYVVRHSAGL